MMTHAMMGPNASQQTLNRTVSSTSNNTSDHQQSDKTSFWINKLEQNFVYNIMLIISLIIISVLVVLLLTKSEAITPKPSLHNSTCLTHACIKESARILRTIDQNVWPCEDFYQFACGKWMDSTIIPEHKSSQSTFDELQDDLNKKIRVLIEKSSNADKRDFVTKVKNLYRSCMNTSLIESLGDEPLINVLTHLGDWPVVRHSKWSSSHFNWLDTYVAFRKLGLSSNMLLSIFVDSDDRNNSRRIIYLDQPTFGLFDRDLLLKGMSDPSVAAYFNLMVNSAVLLGADKHVAVAQMKEVLEFEATLANHSLPKEERRNMSLLYNKMSIEDLTLIAPNTNWLLLLNSFASDPLTKDEEIILIDTTYLKFLDLILPQTKKRTLSNFLLWRVVYSKISLLSSKWRLLEQQYDGVIYGRKRQEPRWEECVSVVKSSMGIALSNLYVKTYFANENKQKITQIIEHIRKEFAKILSKIDWMESETRIHAYDKLANMKQKIGFPDELIDDNQISNHYKLLHTSPDDYFKNKLDIYKWSTDYEFSQLKIPNDINDWRKFSEVADVNAYYFPQENTIVLPAGILQGIFYNKNRPNYLNYGAIGEVVGHEITHGFDDTGRQFDKNGQVNNWWHHSTDENFKNKSKCIVEQYSNYTVKEIGLNINGVNTQGENIADNGGIKEAFHAYKAFVDDHGHEPMLPGLEYTPEQLFWISYGIQSCSKESNEYLKLMIEIDSHCPSRYRVIGTLSNLNEFSQAFDCPLGSPMNPIKKCSIW